VACNAEDPAGLARLFDRHGFAFVLDCAGNCALKPCALNPALAWRLNVEGVRNLITQSVRLGARMVHLSVDLNRLCDTVLAGDLAGIFHAGGPRRLSLYQIAQIINRVGGYNPDCLFGIPREQAGPIPPRAGNVAMNSARLSQSLGFDPFAPWPRDDRWVPTHRNWHRERSGNRGPRSSFTRCSAQTAPPRHPLFDTAPA